jgi:pyruvate formate-lyase/glycerol dehydratase family glycyl radical enzyme
MDTGELTAQEKAIAQGKATWVRTSAGFDRLLEHIRSLPIRLLVERTKILTDVYRKTEGEPVNLRHAQFLKAFAERIPVFIHPDEEIVGSPAPWVGRYVVPFAECDGGGYASLKRMVKDNPAHSEPYIDPSDWPIMEEEIIPYWREHALDVNFMSLLRANAPASYAYGWTENEQPTGVYVETGTGRSSQNWTLDYERVLKKGFAGIRMELEGMRAALMPTDPRCSEKEDFIEAGLLTCEAVVTWANRYADGAEALIEEAGSPEEEAKWTEIAGICRHVPEHPARTFREALQCQWWLQVWTRIELNIGGNVGNGRMDQYLYPYYKADREAGRITDDEVLDLIRMLNLKMYQYIFMPLAGHIAGSTSGFAHFECVTLGGQTTDGRDATNELTYLFLKSKRGVALTMPDLAVRIHSNTPDRLFYEIAETVKEGQGYPKLLNDEIVIPMYLAKGVPLHLANDWTVNGCMECRQIRCEVYNCGSAYNNQVISLEMALNDGKIRRLGDLPVGLKTGDPRQFESFEDLWDVWSRQMRYHLKMVYDRNMLYEGFRSRHIASPLSSIVNEPFMREVKDAMTSGVGFMSKDLVSLVNIDMIGSGTLCDSLTAIKKLIFDEKRFTMAELLEGLEANWKGKEKIRQFCINAPKWGNNDPIADDMMVRINRFMVDEIGKLENPNNVVGRNWELRVLPVTTHIVLGQATGATPNGRRAGEPLSEGAGPQQGYDTKGPTALLNSVSKFVPHDSKHWCSPLLNIKLSPGPLQGSAGTQKLVSLIRGWYNLKIWHIQMNCISAETMRAAQKDPEKYRNLIVRVAGYSAFFSELDQSTQDEIIARTEYSM